MSITTSTLGLNLALVQGLQSQQTTLGQLSEQVSTGQKYDNLTAYSPTDALRLLDLQSTVTQRQSYISSMQTVQTRLSIYNTTMTDIEKITSQASSLASGNPSYNTQTADNIQQLSTSYLKQLSDDFNQEVNGRYIYAGTRYNTPPVTDLTALTGAPTTTTTTSPALPAYDTNFNNATSFSVNAAPSGSFLMGNTSIPWTGLVGVNATNPVHFTVNSVAHTVTVPGLSTAVNTDTYGSNLAATLNAIAGSLNASASGVPSSLTASDTSAVVSLNFNGAAPNLVTPDAGGSATETTWIGGSTPNGLVAQTPNTSATAYTADTVLVDSNYSITYGVTSNDPSFQKLISGLRFMSAAVTAGKSGDTATYQTDMSQASSLLGSALTGIQALHAQVASNQNILTQQTSTQSSDITDLQNQLNTIQKADLTNVGAEISALQTQMQASYASTAALEKLSLVTYL